MRRSQRSALGSVLHCIPRQQEAWRLRASRRVKGRTIRAQVAALRGPIAAASRRSLAGRGGRGKQPTRHS
eukprot:13169591-Alexandrium_andersonii.AAC.1